MGAHFVNEDGQLRAVPFTSASALFIDRLHQRKELRILDGVAAIEMERMAFAIRNRKRGKMKVHRLARIRPSRALGNACGIKCQVMFCLQFVRPDHWPNPLHADFLWVVAQRVPGPIPHLERASGRLLYFDTEVAVHRRSRSVEIRPVEDKGHRRVLAPISQGAPIDR